MPVPVRWLIGVGILFSLYAAELFAGAFGAPMLKTQHNSLVIGLFVAVLISFAVWAIVDAYASRLVSEIHRRTTPIDPSVVEIGERISRRLADND